MVKRLVFTVLSHNITIPFSWESLSDISGLEFIFVPF
jgi:hypothetical protein